MRGKRKKNNNGRKNVMKKGRKEEIKIETRLA
jgi:hypothetical protein